MLMEPHRKETPMTLFPWSLIFIHYFKKMVDINGGNFLKQVILKETIIGQPNIRVYILWTSVCPLNKRTT